MYSAAHAIISLVVAGGVVLAGVPTVHPALAIGYGVALGVLIDLDHFVLSWLLTGSLDPVRRVLARPWIVLTEPDAIFERDDLDPYPRLVSHVIVAGLVVPGVWLVVDPFLGVLSAAVLYAHVLADLLADLWTYETTARSRSG